MRISTYILIVLTVLVLAGSCTADKNKDPQFLKIKEQLDTLSKVRANPSNADSLLGIFTTYKVDPIVAKDTLLSSNLYYHLGKLNAMKGNKDTALIYMEQALMLIEGSTDNWKEKAHIYNGMGNILSTARERQANYYYNKAANIIMADTALEVSPASKIIMLLAAAQSNVNFYQNDLALQMNKAALQLADSLAPEHSSHKRILSQIIQTLFVARSSADSIFPYLQKLDQLHSQHPDEAFKSYLYEAKAKYFLQKNEPDSVLRYQLLRLAIDETNYREDTTVSHFVHNLVVSHTNAAVAYINTNNMEQAARNMKLAGALMASQKEQITESTEIVYKNILATYYEANKEYVKALALMNEVHALQLKNFLTENTQAVAEMNALYQLQTKDRSIRSLNENIKINQLELQQSNLWLTIAALVTILLLSFLVFFYYNVRQRRQRQEKEKVLLQQQLLRTQMEPHFIFNTLAALQSFVRFDKKEKAIKYLNRFSRLLRSSLELSRENLVPLGEEVEALHNYLSLQQMRFEDAFTYELRLPDDQDIDALMVPPMLMQPYVENAILHGIDLSSGAGHILIELELEGDVLRVSISDTGKAAQASDAPHRSLSGLISSERIALLGKKASVNQRDNSQGGTTILIQIPVVNN